MAFKFLQYKAFGPKKIKEWLLYAKLCHYHYNLYILDKVDMVLCPYNYILCPEVKKATKISLDQAIVIFDEAHNVESIAEACLS